MASVVGCLSSLVAEVTNFHQHENANRDEVLNNPSQIFYELGRAASEIHAVALIFLSLCFLLFCADAHRSVSTPLAP